MTKPDKQPSFKKKTRRFTTSRVKGFVCYPTVIEIKQSPTSKPWPTPQILFEDGWTI